MVKPPEIYLTIANTGLIYKVCPGVGNDYCPRRAEFGIFWLIMASLDRRREVT